MASTTSSSFDTLQMNLLNYTREIAYGVAGILILGASIYAYLHYTEQTRGAAQVVLAETLDDMRKAQEGKVAWSDVELAALAGYKNNAATSLAGYFGIVKAQALIRQNKLEQALEVIEESVKHLSASNYLRDLYTILKARIVLRLESAEHKTQMLEQLRAIAHSSASMFQDMALYYLHKHYLSQGENEKALSTLNELKTRFVNPEAPSPWVQLAEQA
jgi:tetratricopeptide (TPR) repeat protein